MPFQRSLASTACFAGTGAIWCFTLMQTSVMSADQILIIQAGEI